MTRPTMQSDSEV